MNKTILKVIIVDDEFLIRELLVEKVDWNKLGCEIVLKASSALELYDYLDEYDADIIITDINMPVVDGLELAETVRSKYPHIRILILTGYNEFEYAKKGIDIGIDGYILKPIDEADIEEIIHKTILSIEKDMNKEIQIEQLMKIINDNKPHLKELFLKDLVSNAVNAEEVKKKSEFFDMDISGTFHQIIAIRFDNKDLVETSTEKKMIKLYRVRMILEELLGDKDGIHIFSKDGDDLLIYSHNNQVKMEQTLAFFLKSIKGSYAGHVYVGLGNVKDIVMKLSTSYHEAMEAAAYGHLQGKKSICHYSETGMIAENDMAEYDLEKVINQIKFYVKASLEKEALECMRELFEGIGVYYHVQDNNDLSYLHAQITKVISSLHFMVLSMELDSKTIMTSEEMIGLYQFGKLKKIQTIPEGIIFLEEVILKVIGALNKTLINRDAYIIDDIEKYIVEKLGDSQLSLTQTANDFYLNPCYLSRLYKQKTGTAFKEHIVNLRIEKAIELLKNTDMKVYEIAEEVGINDPNYFSVCFKKAMNMSVSQYRKDIKQKD